jgi:hypothetical protein
MGMPVNDSPHGVVESSIPSDKVSLHKPFNDHQWDGYDLAREELVTNPNGRT